MSVLIKSVDEFEKFYKQFYSAVFTFLCHYTKDEELASDLTQTTFLQLYERRKEITSVDYAKAFLYTVARHLYWNHCKHLRVQESYFARLNEQVEEDYDFLSEMTRQETIRILYEAVEQLPPRQHQVILLHLEGKNNHEVAEEMGVSVNTVKDLKKSAYTTLRGLLSKHHFHILLFLLEH